MLGGPTMVRVFAGPTTPTYPAAFADAISPSNIVL